MERIGQLRQAVDRGAVRVRRVGRALHGERLVRPFGIELMDEGIEAGLLLQAVHARRPGGLLLEGEMHALVAAVLLRVAGLDALDAMPSLSHQTESLERLNKALGLAKGTPLSERMAGGRPRSRNSRSKAVKASVFAG